MNRKILKDDFFKTALNEEIFRISELMKVTPKLINEAAEPPITLDMAIKFIEKMSGGAKKAAEMTEDDLRKSYNIIRGSTFSDSLNSELEQSFNRTGLSTEQKINKMAENLINNSEDFNKIIDSVYGNLEKQKNKMFDELIQQNPELKRQLDEYFLMALSSSGNDIEMAKEAMRNILSNKKLPGNYVDRYLETAEVKPGAFGSEIKIKDEFKIDDTKPTPVDDQNPLEIITDVEQWKARKILSFKEIEIILKRLNRTFLENFKSRFVNSTEDLEDLMDLLKIMGSVKNDAKLYESYKAQAVFKMQTIVKNSIKDYQNLMNVLKNLSESKLTDAEGKQLVTDLEKKTITDFVKDFNESTFIDKSIFSEKITYGEQFNKTKVLSIWNSLFSKDVVGGALRDAFETWRSISSVFEGAINIFKGGISKSKERTKYFNDAMANFFGDETGSTFKDFITGSRRGIPLPIDSSVLDSIGLGRSEYYALIKLHGYNASVVSYIYTVIFKSMIVVAITTFFETVYEMISEWLGDNEKLEACKTALIKIKKKNPNFRISDKNIDEIPKECRTPGFIANMIFQARLDFNLDMDDDVKDGMKDILTGEIVENTIENAKSLSATPGIFNAVDSYLKFANWYTFNNISSIKAELETKKNEVIEDVKKLKDKTTEQLKNKIDSLSNVNKQLYDTLMQNANVKIEDTQSKIAETELGFKAFCATKQNVEFVSWDDKDKVGKTNEPAGVFFCDTYKWNKDKNTFERLPNCD